MIDRIKWRAEVMCASRHYRLAYFRARLGMILMTARHASLISLITPATSHSFVEDSREPTRHDARPALVWRRGK